MGQALPTHWCAGLWFLRLTPHVEFLLRERDAPATAGETPALPPMHQWALLCRAPPDTAFLLCRAQDQSDGIGQALPILNLGLEVLPAFGGQRVELRLAACVRRLPLRF